MYFYGPGSQLAAWDGFGEPAPLTQRARQIYAGQSLVRELTDRGFQNIFLDRDKLIVVSFWADSCRPCDAVASTVVSVAQKIAQGPHAKLVKFYHAQWDPTLNPRLYKQYGFKNIPVVFFYYMCSGKQPTNDAPLLEASTRGDRFDTDPAAYLRNIDVILRRHGHIVPTRTIAQSRGWPTQLTPIADDGFKDVDQMLVAPPSRVARYFDRLYCTRPKVRLSRLAKIVDARKFGTEYRRINGRPPGPNTLGVVDPRTLEVFLLPMNVQLQVYLNSAVHEAVHLFTCRQRLVSEFYDRLGFGMTEGFTQLMTEDILRAQQVRLASTGRPYDLERQMAEKLVQKLTFEPVAEDYFHCTRKVITTLGVKGVFRAFNQLKIDADNAADEPARRQKYREIIRLLDGLP